MKKHTTLEALLNALFACIEFVENIPYNVRWLFDYTALLIETGFLYARYPFYALSMRKYRQSRTVVDTQRMDTVSQVEQVAASKGIRIDYVNGLVTLYPVQADNVIFNWTLAGEVIRTLEWLQSQQEKEV